MDHARQMGAALGVLLTICLIGLLSDVSSVKVRSGRLNASGPKYATATGHRLETLFQDLSATREIRDKIRNVKMPTRFVM